MSVMIFSYETDSNVGPIDKSVGSDTLGKTPLRGCSAYKVGNCKNLQTNKYRYIQK